MTTDDTGQPDPDIVVPDDISSLTADDEAAAAHNRARLRWPRRLALGGIPVAMLLSFLSSGSGDGALGAVIFFLMMTLFLGLAAVVTAAQLVWDEIKGQPTSRMRTVLSIVLFFLTFFCMIAMGGVSASLAAT